MNLSDFPPDVQAAAIEAGNAFLRDERCGTSVRFGMANLATRAALMDAFAGAIMADRAGRLNTHGLTAMQADCLRYIVDHQRANDGITPSFEEIRAALDLGSRSGVMRLLDALEERGRISRLAHRARSITIIPYPAN